jgi:colanic acid/amylovoran biosynthesis protein
MKLLFTNIFNFSNRGEVLQLEALIRHLKAEFSVLSIYSYIDQKMCEVFGVRVVGTYRPRRLLHLAIWALYTTFRALLWRLTHISSFLNEELREILRSDIIVDLGGDTFSDEPSILYAVAHSYSLILAKLLTKPYIVLSQSIGPFKTPLTRLLAKIILRGALVITVREPLSYSYLTVKLRLENVYLTHDVAFLSPIKTNDISKRLAGGFVVGLNVSPLVSSYAFPSIKDSGEKQKLFAKLMSEVVDYISERYGYRILLIPHVTGPVGKKLRDDRVIARMVFGNICNARNIELILFDDPFSIGDAISSCNIFIASRMHAAISAISAGIPSLLLAYSSKTLGLANALGLHDYAIDVREREYEELKNEIISKLEYILSDYSQALKVFEKAYRDAVRGANLNIKVIKTWKLLSSFRKKMKYCMSCGTCVVACPHGAVSMVLTRLGVYRPRLDFEKCTGCGACIRACPLG